MTSAERKALIAEAQEKILRVAEDMSTSGEKCAACGLTKHTNRGEYHASNDLHAVIRKLGKVAL